MWDHLPVEALIGMNAGVGAGRSCAVLSWQRTVDEIRQLPETGTSHPMIEPLKRIDKIIGITAIVLALCLIAATVALLLGG